MPYEVPSPTTDVPKDAQSSPSDQASMEVCNDGNVPGAARIRVYAAGKVGTAAIKVLRG